MQMLLMTVILCLSSFVFFIRRMNKGKQVSQEITPLVGNNLSFESEEMNSQDVQMDSMACQDQRRGLRANTGVQLEMDRKVGKVSKGSRDERQHTYSVLTEVDARGKQRVKQRVKERVKERGGNVLRMSGDVDDVYVVSNDLRLDKFSCYSEESFSHDYVDEICAGEISRLHFNRVLREDLFLGFFVDPDLSCTPIACNDCSWVDRTFEKAGEYELIILKDVSWTKYPQFFSCGDIPYFCRSHREKIAFRTSFNVIPGCVSQKHSYLSRHSMRGEVGYEQTVLIELNDLQGNSIKDTNDVSILILGPTNNRILYFTKEYEGLIEVKFHAFKAGEYKISVTSQDVHINSSPMVMYFNHKPNTDKWKLSSSIQSYQILAGEEISIDLTAFDEFGNKMSYGGDENLLDFYLTSTVQRDNKIKAHVVSHNNGKYTVSFSTTIAGDYILDHEKEYHKVTGLPLSVAVSPQIFDYNNCFFSGDLISNPRVGIENSFVVILRDQFNNQVFDSSLRLFLIIDKKEYPVINNQDGTYSVFYTPDRVGTTYFSVRTKKARNLRSFDKISCINPKEGISYAVLEDSVGEARSGDLYEIKVNLRDSQGEILDRESIKVHFDPPSGVELVSIEKLPSSNYSIKIRCMKVDTYNITMWENDTKIENIEYSLSVKHSSIYKLELLQHQNSTFANDTTTFIWRALDVYDNPVYNLSDYTISAQLVDMHGKISVAFVELSNDLLSVPFFSMISGKYTVQVWVNHCPKGSSVITVKNREASPLESEVIDVEIDYTLDEIAFGQTIKILAKDEFGNTNFDGGDEFTADLIPLHIFNVKIPLNVIDNKNGTYDLILKSSCNYTGYFECNVKLNNERIRNSPVKILIKSGATCFAESFAYGPGLAVSIPRSKARPAQFTIQACDIFKNRKLDGGDKWRVKLTNEGTHRTTVIESGQLDQTKTIRDNYDGTYTVFYFISEVGQYYISMELLPQNGCLDGMMSDTFSVNIIPDMNFEQKRDLILNHLNIDSNILYLNIDRRKVYESSLLHIEQYGENQIVRPNKLNIKFIGEDGIDVGGLSKEFVTALAQDIFEGEGKHLWKVTKDRCYYPAPGGSERDLFLIGKFIGIFVWLNIKSGKFPFPVSLSNFFCEFLLGNSEIRTNPNLEYLRSYDSDIENQFKNYLSSDIEFLDLDFRVVDKEFLNEFSNGYRLIENGSNIMVTNYNKREFVDRSCHFYLYEQFKEEVVMSVFLTIGFIFF
eukprot:TRINITY_DN1480_c0_g1_i3.p1 TRINITY_DN1480_c0_g1~~TRINITY_DN1480_c0_g1_i3.p1  ORF type:complete len:1236 (-),score=227.98 TRINITY_DN1480_c0_g1_i3:615-4322(-)